MKKLKNVEIVSAAAMATNLATALIASHGMKQALLISRLTQEKVIAQHKLLKGKYSDEGY